MAKHEYTASIRWERGASVFSDNKYSRAHAWQFDGGATVRASSAPDSVPVPMSDPAGVDPEEALVASLSACHMLFFLYHACKQGFIVDRYEDDALGVMGRNPRGKISMLKATMRPRVTFSGRQPTAEELQALHHRSHEDCYIANSVNFEVVVEPTV